MPNHSRYRILAIGKVRKRWIQDGLALYLKRLPGLTITELRESNPERDAKTIMDALKSDEKLIALTEEGESMNSITFTNRLEKLGSQRLAFVIGGADGLDPTIKTSANLLLSLSPMTFPHELARLLLTEQLYRAISISRGSPYHR